MTERKWYLECYDRPLIGGVACIDCRTNLKDILLQHSTRGALRMKPLGLTDVSCTTPFGSCADKHVCGDCNHEFGLTTESKPKVITRDRLPSGMSRRIYDHFKDQEFKTVDVTRRFGKYAGDIMKELRAKGMVDYSQPCGEYTHYIHRFA